MYAMSQHAYAYPAQAPPQPAPQRQYSGHGTSSAFSSSANPDEDWTKISDLAERRRIQNRIAQRNYRKKLKRRLEDLERRAGKSDGASSPGSEKATPTKTSSSKRGQQQQPQQPQHPHQQHPSQAQHQQAPHHQQHVSKSQKQSPVGQPRNMPQNQFTPPPMHDEEYLFANGNAYDERERSHTPPMFYPTYPPPPPSEEMLLAPYGSAAPSQPPYRPMTTEAYPEYLTATSVPVTLPSMTHFSDAIKREPGFPGSDEFVYMNYNGYVPGVDMSSGLPPPYDHSNPHTPPLSHSYDHSASCSDSGSYEYPTTPLSMPGSPCLVQQQI